MIPWIQVYTNLISHAKTGRLVDALGLRSGDVEPEAVAAGMLISLWTWAAQNAYNGDLSQCSPRVIAGACRYKKNPERLVQALMDCGWIDQDMQLHDWYEHAEMFMAREEERRAKNRERVRRYRNKKSEECNAPDDVTCNRYSNVTVSECNAPTIPDLTIPDHNQPELSIFLPEERKKEKKERSDGIEYPPDDELPYVRLMLRNGEPVTPQDIESGRRIWAAQHRAVVCEGG